VLPRATLVSSAVRGGGHGHSRAEALPLRLGLALEISVLDSADEPE
jgi:hypothetical protein